MSYTLSEQKLEREATYNVMDSKGHNSGPWNKLQAISNSEYNKRDEKSKHRMDEKTSTGVHG